MSFLLSTEAAAGRIPSIIDNDIDIQVSSCEGKRYS